MTWQKKGKIITLFHVKIVALLNNNMYLALLHPFLSSSKISTLAEVNSSWKDLGTGAGYHNVLSKLDDHSVMSATLVIDSIKKTDITGESY